ncbi:SWIM zinc finger family protein [Nonomuraea sp. SMC257]|uniref:SWIM zinc finger family protein n=1 Tax=Nonomuraea montanisoli TaxID=2741721 RepID=A0A7Y6IGV5_9ACTN|nr:SWIM zinc finger family protein [Nonomuraea montanisoli]NUW37345.1 SWIM zinc finger family protein [Nonomuraea montanisoli]
MSPNLPPAALPPVAPHVVAAAVEGLTSRLRKKLDAAVEQYAALPVVAVDGEGLRITCGEDAVVTLSPGASGVVEEEGQAGCSCLLAPRCLHRAAVLSACPPADATPAEPTTHATDPPPTAAQPEAPSQATAPPPRTEPTVAEPASPGEATTAGSTSVPTGPTPGQVGAAAGLWAAGSAVLAAGISAAGAVPQAELLRAAHSARLAGLPRAEAAALRVVRGLRSAREQRVGHRLSDLVSALRELLLIAGRLAAGDPDPALTGTVRRAYEQGGSLRVYGVFREPVISATGYGGVVTHVVTEDGRWFSVSDVKPGGAARARGAATATVAIGSATLNHSQLAKSGLLIVGATVSPDGRLGAGKGVRATPVRGMPWTEGPMGDLFARPLAEQALARLSGEVWSESGTEEVAREPVACDLMIVGASGDHVLARMLTSATPAGPMIRLVPANRHQDLAHVANLGRLASCPGLCVRVVGRVEPDRATTLRPFAVGPVPGAEMTLRLPAEWQDRADLGYDRLQGAHLPPPVPLDGMPISADGMLPSADGMLSSGERADPLASAPLWRVRRLIELAVAGGRRAVAESGRGGDSKTQAASLRRAGFKAAAELVAGLTAEADRRERDVFGRLTDPGLDRYTWAWLAAATHLAATERALVQASWRAGE